MRYRVYVAGKYGDDSVTGVQNNIRRGMLLAFQALRRDFAVFAPWLDFQFGAFGYLSVETMKAQSMAWLETADAVLVQPVGVDTSTGTQEEIVRAYQLGIPVFYALDDLLKARASGELDAARLARARNAMRAFCGQCGGLTILLWRVTCRAGGRGIARPGADPHKE